MIYLFIGVAIASDKFMESIEMITAQEKEVGNSLVPDLNNDSLGLSSLGVLDGNFLLLSSDHFDRLHELVRGDGDTNEEVDHQSDIKQTTSKSVSHRHVLVSRPDWDDQTIFAVDSRSNILNILVIFVISIIFLGKDCSHQQEGN